VAAGVHEIVKFEQGICAEGLVLVKLWLHVSEPEQLRRFRARERDPLKRWKLTGEDWRNLSKRGDYERAVAEMLRKTDHQAAPWRLISAEHKPYARLAVVRGVIDALEQGLRDADQEPLDLEAAL
jgi:AMP-polyphosphate phosphotransferase